MKYNHAEVLKQESDSHMHTCSCNADVPYQRGDQTLSMATRRLGFQIRNLQTLKQQPVFFFPIWASDILIKVPTLTSTIALSLLHSCCSCTIGYTAAAPVRTSSRSQRAPCHWFIQLTDDLVLLNPSSPALCACFGAAQT